MISDPSWPQQDVETIEQPKGVRESKVRAARKASRKAGDGARGSLQAAVKTSDSSAKEADQLQKAVRFVGSAPLRRVALLIETSGSYGRGILRGVAKYNRAHGGWSTYFQPHGLGDVPPPWLSGWKGDGIIARARSKDVAEMLAQLGIPVVIVGRPIVDIPIPSVRADPIEVGRMGAEHLMARCLRNYAFYGRRAGTHLGQDEIGAVFQRTVTAPGRTCSMFPVSSANLQETWESRVERLADWIRGLPKPVGIMAFNDEGGLQVLDACRRCGASVPDEVAVIGADDDEHLCDLAIPPLTSIDLNSEKIGHTAAILLDQMMQGRKVSAKSHVLPPRGVVSRLSTDTVASNDEEVNRAIRYIREHGCNGLRVTGVLAYMGISRASLQHRMKKITGRTIHREIEHVRLTRVKDLLLSPDMTIKQAARAAGFSSVQYMTRVFRVAVGQTPARYRGYHNR